MRFECKVRVVNRNPGGKSCNSYITSTIALGKETYTENDYFLLHFSNTARGSLKGSRYTKYHLKKNPTKVFTKCVNEGKITISFEDPMHDLFIQGEALQLSRFVELLNLCLAGEVDVLPTTITEEAKERYNMHLNKEKQSLLQNKKKAKKSVPKKKDTISKQEITATDESEKTFNEAAKDETLGLILTIKEEEKNIPEENDADFSKLQITSAVEANEMKNIHENKEINHSPEVMKLEEQTSSALLVEKDIISIKNVEITSTDVAKDICNKHENKLCLTENKIDEEEKSEPTVNTNYRRKKQKIKYRRLELWFSDSLRN